ncbi:TonB-dependent receptor plug domain-containing protein [Sphingomonas aerolata]|uniref:TonB-dependent receptor plug domain-containing protein n=1 Tax=Sphingomonas aerolata TaxID=185951 RepID=UPI002FE1963F
MKPFRQPRLTRAALLCATTLAVLAPSIALAQTVPPPQEQVPDNGQDPAPATPPAPQTEDTQGTPSEDIVVTGYRSSLAKSTDAKRASTGFTDSIFAEDIGKFPDTNIAESFNRIPGITITRDVTGEGTNVAIRGLGSNFTNVTLNGATIAVASSGATDAQGTDRSVDLSFFPTELFTKLTVNKSYTADLLEGGAAGNIDLRSARPLDRATGFLNYNVQGTRQSPEDRIGARGALIGSWRTDTFGILAGVSAQRLFTDTRGFETIGYTNPALTAAQCGATSGCNTTGGGNWTIPAVVPVGAGAGLVAERPSTGRSCSRTTPVRRSSRSTTRCSRGSVARPASAARATGSTRSSAPNGSRPMRCISTSTVCTATRRTNSRVRTWPGSSATARSSRPT